jgi:hypothetical protein
MVFRFHELASSLVTKFAFKGDSYVLDRPANKRNFKKVNASDTFRELEKIRDEGRIVKATGLSHEELMKFF